MIRVLLVLLGGIVSGLAAPPARYYASAEGKCDSELKAALHAIKVDIRMMALEEPDLEPL